jgi:hypothetical protein
MKLFIMQLSLIFYQFLNVSAYIHLENLYLNTLSLCSLAVTIHSHALVFNVIIFKYCHVLRMGNVTKNTTRARIDYRIYSL